MNYSLNVFMLNVLMLNMVLASTAFAIGPAALRVPIAAPGGGADPYPYVPRIDVDLNGGEALRLPDKASGRVAVRYDATPVESYVSIGDHELRNLSVDIRPTPGFANQERLVIELPRPSQGVKVDWELYWFAKDRPITLNGFSFSQNGQVAWGSQDGLGDATAVSGWAKVTVPTNFARIEFRKTNSGVWQSRRAGRRFVCLSSGINWELTTKLAD